MNGIILRAEIKLTLIAKTDSAIQSVHEFNDPSFSMVKSGAEPYPIEYLFRTLYHLIKFTVAWLKHNYGGYNNHRIVFNRPYYFH